MEPDLTLKSAISKVRQSEMIKQQQPTVRSTEQKVEAISSKKSANFRKRVNDLPKQISQIEGTRQRYVPGVVKLDIINNIVIALQNKQHVGSATRKDTFKACVELRKWKLSQQVKRVIHNS